MRAAARTEENQEPAAVRGPKKSIEIVQKKLLHSD